MRIAQKTDGTHRSGVMFRALWPISFRAEKDFQVGNRRAGSP